MAVRAVLFDLDETLIRRAGAVRRFIADQYTRHAAALAPLTTEQYTSRFLTLEDEGRIDKAKVYPALVAALGITGISADALLQDYRANYPHFAALNPGAVETLRALRDHGIKTGVITNGNGVVQNGKIDATDIRPLLDVVVISEVVGLRKPDPAIFDLAVRTLGLTAADCLFVGDNPEADVAGADAAGLTGVWFRADTPWPATQPAPRFTIAALAECLPLAGLAAS